MKDLRVIKIVKEIKFEQVWCKLEAKKNVSRGNQLQIFETNSSFHVKERSTGKH